MNALLLAHIGIVSIFQIPHQGTCLPSGPLLTIMRQSAPRTQCQEMSLVFLNSATSAPITSHRARIWGIGVNPQSRFWNAWGLYSGAIFESELFDRLQQ